MSNNSGKIPKAERAKSAIPVPPKKEGKLLTFSFEALEYNKYFNLDATCERWSVDLLRNTLVRM